MKNRNIDMMTKPNFVITFSPILLSALLVGAGCQMIDGTAVAENNQPATPHQTIRLVNSTLDSTRAVDNAITLSPIWESLESLPKPQAKTQSLPVVKQKPTTPKNSITQRKQSTVAQAPTAQKSKQLVVNNNIAPKKVTLEALAANSMQMAEQQANSNNTIVRIKHKTTDVIPDSVWPSNLNTITLNAIQIAEDNANAQDTSSLQRQAALKRLVEQHFQQ